MKANIPRFVPAALILGCCTDFASGALSADLPKRKSGLWEIRMRIDGMTHMGPMQQCIDQNTDNLMLQRAREKTPECGVMDTQATDNKLTVHAVCKMGETTITTDGVFEGAFDSAYKGTLKSTYNPPLHGMRESTLTQEARWLGPCKAGQKPGDVVMPSSDKGGVNINEMMKDPKIQEMLRQQQKR